MTAHSSATNVPEYAINELVKADIIESIRPEDMKCVSPITLAQKVHMKEGLS
jgi:hypothetical protein